MIKLNLTANNNAEQKIKDYLEQNASEILADKINNGVQIQKANVTLLNKKDLTGFMQYACRTAQEQAAKGATSACIDSRTVFGWAIHYFEEDSIEGKLYNLDGSEYQPQTKTANTKPTLKAASKKPETPQMSLFDTPSESTDNDVWQDDSFDQAMQTISPTPQVTEHAKDNYPKILNQILNGKLEVAL